MDDTAFRRLVSGECRGLQAAWLRCGLSIAAAGYGLGVRLRNLAFDRRLRRVHTVGVPVISVGNLTVGGTGKTPLVAWLADWLVRQGTSVCLLSRGYGAPDPDGISDEQRLLEQLCPGVPHVVDPDRVAGARRAIAETGCGLLLLDDGFQHRRLGRDSDIVLVDATCPFGYGHLLPRGLLREPAGGLARATQVVITRADQVSETHRRELRQQLVSLAGHDALAEVAFRPLGLVNAEGDRLGLDHLERHTAAVFCGIGNPEAFFRGFEGPRAVATRSYPDHHAYSVADLQKLGRWAESHQADLLLTTRKDLVKIPRPSLEGLPLWAVETGVEFLSGQEEFQRRLAESVAG